MRNLTLTAAAAAACGGAFFAHALDAPHIISPAEFRVLADVA